MSSSQDKREHLILSLVAMIESEMPHLSVEGIATASDTVQSALLEARARSFRRWNERHPDRLSRLPVEVHTRIFELLPLRHRIAATHVCHHWRAVALGSRSLWRDVGFHEFETISTRCDGVAILEEMLARAGPGMPVRLSGVHDALDVPGRSVSEFVSRHLDRFARVSGAFAVEWPSCTDAPDLTSLDSLGLRLPHGWGEAAAPRLRKISVRRLRLAAETLRACGPVHTGITHLCLTYTPTDPNDFVRRMCTFFPNLQTLVVRGLVADCVVMEDIPETMLDLELGNELSVSRRCMGKWRTNHRLQRLQIRNVAEADDLVNSECFATVVDFFVSSINRAPWRMTVSEELRTMELESFGDRTFHLGLELYIPEDFLIDALPSSADIFAHLQSLTLTHYAAVYMHMEEVWFPALTDIRLDLYGFEYSDNYQREWFYNEVELTFYAPKLRRLVLEGEKLPSDAESDPDAVLPLLCNLFDSEDRLESITILSEDEESFDRCDWSSILSRTEFLVLDDCRILCEPTYRAP